METKILNIEEAIITDWLSPDERYCIFLDELYDIREKKLIGNIWENFENFKFFIRYSTSVSELKAEIKESIYGSLNSMVLTESINESISKHKNIIKEFINENIFGDFVDWAKESGKSSVSGLRDFVKTTSKGVSDVFDKISDFDLKAAFEIISKGIFYFLRKLRDALYHPVGMVLDAILVASGIGKTLQWIPWALVVGLDIYEIFSGNYEESIFEKLLFTLFDVIAMISTGAIAKGLRISLKGVSKVDDLVKVANKNKNVRQIFQKLPEYLKKISPMINKAISYLSTRFPKGANFLRGILKNVDKFINKVTQEFGKLFTKKVAVTGAVTTGVTFGFEKLMKKILNPNEREFSQDEIDALLDGSEDFIDTDTWG